MYKFYDLDNVLVMETQNPVWINWDRKAKSFKVCKINEREGVLIQREEDNEFYSYEASIQGEIVHIRLPIVRMEVV